jgi:DNA-binding NtrC family response regulator
MATIGLIGSMPESLRLALLEAGHAVESNSLESALDGSRPASDLALVDYGAASATASASEREREHPVDLIRRLSLHSPATAWVLLWPNGDPGVAAQVLSVGAADVWFEWPSPSAAKLAVQRLLRDHRLRTRQEAVDDHVALETQRTEVIGESKAMRELLGRVSRLARRSALGPPISILLTGETGTGKGLLARMLHQSGRRRPGPFIEVNCAALPAALLEDELYGHERGAFTDARAARAGLFEAAEGGSLFLDEVSYLSLEGQAKLLTALETRRVRRIGGSAERPVDVQIIAATSQDLRAQVERGAFRSELFHRLTSVWFHLPPLREREADALKLAEHFLVRVCRDYALTPKRLSDSARAAIAAHHWPGNVRELLHAIERSVLVEEREVVEEFDLALQGSSVPVIAVRKQGISVSLPPEGVALEDVERALIQRSLEVEKGNVTRAAALLRISRDKLRSRMERLQLSSANDDADPDSARKG